MKRPLVFITKGVPEQTVFILKKAHYRVKQGTNIKKEGRGAEGIVCLLTDTIDKKVMAAIGPQLKVVSNMAAGTDNIDTKEAKKRKIVVANTPGVLTQAVAEHTIALLLSLSRRIVEGDSFVRKGKYKGWKPDLLLGSELEGKTLGIVGHGRIGCRVADILHKGFGMRVLYYDVKGPRVHEVCGAKKGSLKELLRRVDVVSLHVPLLPSTHHLISAKELKGMKKTALLLNTARGGVVNERVLVSALRGGGIAGAALDVFEEEPKLAPGLAKLSNVVLTPHIASASHEARLAMAELAAKNVILVLENL